MRNDDHLGLNRSPKLLNICAGYDQINKLNKVHNSVIKIRKLEVHKTCEKIGITPPENGNRNHYGPDLVQAFQKKWWVKSRFYSALNLPLPLRH